RAPRDFGDAFQPRLALMDCTVPVSCCCHSEPPLCARDRLNRLDDLRITGAAAEIACDPPADLFFGRLRVVPKQRGARHEHSWYAEPALQRAMFHECRLQGVQFA